MRYQGAMHARPASPFLPARRAARQAPSSTAAAGRLAPLLLPALLAALPGCFLFDSGGPQQVEGCAPGTGDPSEKRAVALGEGRGKDFEPYADGGAVPLVSGSQGFDMITPSVRVEGKPGDPSEACLLVEITTVYNDAPGSGGAGGAPGGGGQGGSFSEDDTLRQGAKFVLVDGDLFTDGVLYNPLFGSTDLTLTVTVTGEDFDGTSTVAVHGERR